jgi:hypothetical protein
MRSGLTAASRPHRVSEQGRIGASLRVVGATLIEDESVRFAGNPVSGLASYALKRLVIGGAAFVGMQRATIFQVRAES